MSQINPVSAAALAAYSAHQMKKTLRAAILTLRCWIFLNKTSLKVH